jgi:phage terminase large subunit-like protein
VTTGNVPRGIQTPALNSIKTWAASDVVGCGRTRRTNKYGHESPRNKLRKANVHRLRFNRQPPERVYRQRGKQIILPKNRCVMCTCVPFVVVSDRTKTHTDLSYKTWLDINGSPGETKFRRT